MTTHLRIYASTLLLLLAAASRGEVNSAVDCISYNGNGSTKTFTVPFGLFSTSTLRVVCRTTATAVENVQVLNSDFTATDNDSDGDWWDGTPGGSITFTTAPASGVEVWISRLPPLTQTSDIDGSAYVRLATIEDAVDKLAVQQQYLRGLLWRVPMAAETDRQAVDMNMPAGWSESTGALWWDGASWGMASSDLADVAASSYWAGILTETALGGTLEALGLGESAGNLTLKSTANLDQVFDVRDYGATGNGTTPDSTAIQAAIDAAEAAGGGEVFFPIGRYLLTSALSVPSKVVLRGVTTYTGSVLQAKTDIGIITTDNSAVSWKIRDLAITVLDAAGGDTTTAAISLGSNNSQWEIENVEIIDSGSYDFQDGLYIPSGWTSTVKRFRCANAARYALNMAGGQAIHFDQCDFSGLDLTACALVAGNACTFTNCKFQGRPIGLSLTGNRNTFVTPWFENDYETDGLWCAQVSGSNNTFLNGSYTISGYTAGAASGYFKFAGSATQNQVINPRWDHPATASMVSLESSATFNEFYGGNVRWATVITQAGETNTYSMLSDTSVEQILRYWYGDDNVEVHFGDPSAGIRLKTGVSDVSSEESPGLYTTASGGFTPYDAWGNLIIKPRNQASRSVEVWTGATPAVRQRINETATYGNSLFPLADNTYYLGKNDDDSPAAWKGLVLKDTGNGKYYLITINNGTLTATDLTD